MGIHANELQALVIKPVLQEIGHYSETASQLLLATAAHASLLGLHLHDERQQRFGLYQIQRRMHGKVWDEYLAYNPDLASTVRGFASQKSFLRDPDAELTVNLRYATAIAWSLYLFNGVQLPLHGADPDALAQCWHRYFDIDSRDSCKDFKRHYRQMLEIPHAA